MKKHIKIRKHTRNGVSVREHEREIEICRGSKSIMLKKAKVPNSKFNQSQLRKGMKVEREHSNNPKIERAIAKAHLSENPDYYRPYTGKGKEYLVSTK